MRCDGEKKYELAAVSCACDLIVSVESSAVGSTWTAASAMAAAVTAGSSQTHVGKRPSRRRARTPFLIADAAPSAPSEKKNSMKQPRIHKEGGSKLSSAAAAATTSAKVPSVLFPSR